MWMGAFYAKITCPFPTPTRPALMRYVDVPGVSVVSCPHVGLSLFSMKVKLAEEQELRAQVQASYLEYMSR